MALIGSVVIGRNEGERLKKCLTSLQGSGPIVYVDSQSTDGSAEAAKALGAEVVALDLATPFTAARARNEGFARLIASQPALTYVQFIDGDCEVIPGWTGQATEFLDAHPHVAAVCGRRLERYPDASIYNAMCHAEWNTPPGEADACGGDSVMRIDAFRQIGGFSGQLIAHEEPEMCGRLRRTGWKIWRLDTDMTLHDAAISRFGQFYKRNRRAGFGMIQALTLSGWSIDAAAQSIVRRALIWALAIPFAVIAAFAISPLLGVAALGIYPFQILRHAMGDVQGVGGSISRRVSVAAISMAGKFAEAHGVLEFAVRKGLHMKLKSIYYK